MVFKFTGLLARNRLSDLHSPLAFVFVPESANHFAVVFHVFAEIEYVAYFVEVLPYVWAVAEESRPLWILFQVIRPLGFPGTNLTYQRELIGVGVRWNITTTTCV